MVCGRLFDSLIFKHFGVSILTWLLVGCAGGGGVGEGEGAESGGGDSINFAGLNWAAPSEREDGTPLSLSDIAGYRIYYGDETGDYPNKIDIIDSTAEKSLLKNISGGMYFVVITTVDSDGRESVFSQEVSISL